MAGARSRARGDSPQRCERHKRCGARRPNTPHLVLVTSHYSKIPGNHCCLLYYKHYLSSIILCRRASATSTTRERPSTTHKTSHTSASRSPKRHHIVQVLAFMYGRSHPSTSWRQRQAREPRRVRSWPRCASEGESIPDIRHLYVLLFGVVGRVHVVAADLEREVLLLGLELDLGDVETSSDIFIG